MWQYGPIDPGSAPIIWVYASVTAFCTVMTVLLYRRWLQRKTPSAKLLLITFTSYLTCIIMTMLGFIEVLVTLEKGPFYGFSLAFSFSGFMVSNIFLMYFAHQVFELSSRFLKAYSILAIAIAVSLALPWNYYGILQSYTPFTIRPFTMGLFALVSIMLYSKILSRSIQVSSSVDDNVGKRGFMFIGISQFCLIVFFILMVADMIYFGLDSVLTGYTIFNYAAWIAATFFFTFAYLGLIMPDWLKRVLETSKK